MRQQKASCVVAGSFLHDGDVAGTIVRTGCQPVMSQWSMLREAIRHGLRGGEISSEKKSGC